MRISHKCLLTIVFFAAIFYHVWVYTSTEEFEVLFQYYSYQYSTLDGEIDATFPMTFYHKSYIDYRTTPPRLKIFSLNPCIRNSNYISIDVFFEGNDNPKKLKLHGQHLEGPCPTKYAPSTSCFYSPHTFTIEIDTPGKLEKVIVHRGKRRIELSVNVIEKPQQPGLTVCLQPVYYYSQWQNIVLYLEAWRAQGASRFIVFFHSATEDTRKVLRYYENLGIIELRPWPSFGELPVGASRNNPRFDDSVFIFSYVMAMNLCILDIKTSLGTIADFDEVMVSRNESVLEYALREMTNTNVGALMFENTYVSFSPRIYSSNFSGISHPNFLATEGPPKNIFNATAIDIAYVHEIKLFSEPKITKRVGQDGALLHFRYFYGDPPTEPKNATFTFFPNSTDTHIKNMQNTAHQIFKGSYPVFNPDLIDGLNSCVFRIRESKITCRSTGGMCKAEMDKLANWVYDTTENVFLA